MRQCASRRLLLASLGVCCVVLVPASGWGCSWASGYFHQVTSLKGRVVGKSLGPLSQWRWLRQSFDVPSAELVLSEYREYDYGPVVARVVADKDGRFDFGTLPKGHYTLKIVAHGLEDVFEIEVVERAAKTTSVLIDISPVFPNCKGGHEFIEKRN